MVLVGSRARSGMARYPVWLLVAGLVLGLSTLANPNAAAADPHDGTIVSDDPANYTPDVLDGKVESLVEIGGKIIAAGSFTQVREKGTDKPTLTRLRVFAFDPATGAVDPDFAPQVDGGVKVVYPGPTANTVYIGGTFGTLNGDAVSNLALVDVTDGTRVSSFSPGSINGRVNDLRVVRDQLVLVGTFTHVDGVNRAFSASMSATTGAVTDFFQFVTADPRQGSTSIAKIDVTPNGERLVAIGNFSTIDGQSRPQLAVFDVSGPQASLSEWRSGFFRLDACNPVFWTYLRDLDIDPAGEFFVVTTTGSYGGPTSPCDVEVRFELGATGNDIEPTWRAYTGGDTAYAVEITPSVVYVGGHFRWFNNPYGEDYAGPGAISRGAIAALDPRNGMPLSWNPTRSAGVGVFDFLATDRGLYFGSDTDLVAGEWHRKLAFFPTGDQPLPAEVTGELPADVYLLGRSGGNDVGRYFVDGNGVPSNPAVLDGPEAWGSARGSFMIDDTLYTGWADGTLKRRSFDGTSYGAVSDVDLYGGYFGGEVSDVTGIFYEKSDARIYFTLAGKDALYWRAFQPESDAVGATRYEASGEISALDPSTVRSMFLSGDRLYFVDESDGNLYSVQFVRGTVEGPRQLVDDSVDWLARGAFVFPGESAPADDPVADDGWSVLRLAGVNRYSTAVAVSQDSFDPGVSTVYVASGENFPDALSAVPAAGRSGGPLLLVQRDAVPAAVLAELRRLDPNRIVVVGGAGVVSASVESQLRAVAPTVRQAGANRYATSAAVSAASYPGGADVAYLATGAVYADALSAGPVAARRGAPVLLTSPSGLSAETAAELRRLGVDAVVIAGGTGAVSGSVEQALRAQGYAVSRAAGADRFATAAALSRSEFGAQPVETVFLATGRNFPDALGGGAAAAVRGVPMLLTERACMPPATLGELVRLGPSTVRVTGGTAVVSDAAARGSSC